MRMALNQLQYMSLSMAVINYDDMKQRLVTSAKDEDISPFTAVDKYEFHALSHPSIVGWRQSLSFYYIPCLGKKLHE